MKKKPELQWTMARWEHYSQLWEVKCGEEKVAFGIRTEKQARLVATAPDLLEACKAAYVDLYGTPGRSAVVKLLEEAIAKAEGK